MMLRKNSVIKNGRNLMPTDIPENEEFEFRLRAENEAKPAISRKQAGAGRGFINPPRVNSDVPESPKDWGSPGRKFMEEAEGAISDLKAGAEGASIPQTIGRAMYGIGETALSGITMGDVPPKTPMGKGISRLLGASSEAVSGVVGDIAGDVSGEMAKSAGVSPQSVEKISMAGESIGKAGTEAGISLAGFRKAPGALKESTSGPRIPLPQKEEAIKSMMDDGYKTMPGKVVTSIGGKDKIKSDIILKNQEKTNSLAKEELGISPDSPLNEDIFLSQREPHYAKYEAVKNLPDNIRITPDAEFRKNIRGLSELSRIIQDSFPEYKTPKGMEKDRNLLINTAPRLSPRAIIEIAKDLRETARHDLGRREISSGDKKTALSKITAANELEAMLERGLTKRAQARKDVDPSVIQGLRDARVEIAKSHNVQSATNLDTGAVDATKLQAMKKKGVPLSGNLDKIARARSTAPDVVRNTDGLHVEPTFRLSDLGMGAGVAGAAALTAHSPLAAAGVLAAGAARPVSRALATTDAWQNRMVKPVAKRKPTDLVKAYKPGTTAFTMGSVEDSK